VVIPAGSRVRLTVTSLAPAGSRSAADGQLAFRVDEITIGDSVVPVKARVGQIPHRLEGRGVTGSEAAKVGAGAAAGAVAGRVLGGDAKGAVIGGVVGAAGGAAVATQTAKRDVVGSGAHSGQLRARRTARRGGGPTVLALSYQVRLY
jgi:hypothetical protein